MAEEAKRPKKKAAKKPNGPTPTAYQRIRAAVVARAGCHLSPTETAAIYFGLGLGPLASQDDEQLRPAQMALDGLAAATVLENGPTSESVQ